MYKCNKNSIITESLLKCNTTCNSEDEFYRNNSKECCGHCSSKFCVDEKEGKKYNSGDTWKSPDNCTIYECVDDGIELRMTSYQKTCPKLQNCPTSSIEMRDCCPYCNYRRDSKYF